MFHLVKKHTHSMVRYPPNMVVLQLSLTTKMNEKNLNLLIAVQFSQQNNYLTLIRSSSTVFLTV